MNLYLTVLNYIYAQIPLVNINNTYLHLMDFLKEWYRIKL